MIKQIQSILETYKQQKTALDTEWSATEKGWREKLSPSYIQEIRPEFEAKHREKEFTLRSAALALIEEELAKIDAWANYLNTAIDTAAMQEIRSLEGLQLSESQISALLEKYKGNFYATAAFCEMVNKTRPTAQQISYTSPDDYLAARDEIERDALFVLNNYSAEGFSGNAQAAVKLEVIQSRFGGYADRLTTEFLSEPDLDRPAPLTSTEKSTVAYLFSGCQGSYDKKERAAELVKQGHGGLVARSEFAQYLPTDWKTMSAPELTDRQKAALVGYNAEIPTAAEALETARDGAGNAIETL